MREATAARWFFAGVVAFALLGTLSTIAFAFELTQLVVNPANANVWLAISAAAVKAATMVDQEWLSSIAATRVKAQLRSKLLGQIGEANRTWISRQNTSELQLLLTTGLDSLDAYFAKFLPQIVYTALAVPIYVLAIFTQDALSAFTVLLTMPLIPLFMIFIGWATAKVQNRQLASLTALSTHFADALRGITTLKVFGRAEAQVEIMRSNSEQHRKRTMKVLSVSFLSGFALELVASLAVALVAVSIGLRLIDGTITLAAGLLVLVLAPDAYLPLRMIGANFHASSDGVAAIQRTFALIDSQADAAEQAEPMNIEPLAGRLIVLTGPSGSGKSTALKALINQNSAWMPQGASLLDGTVRSNIVGPGSFDEKSLQRAAHLAALDDLDFDLEVGASFSTISGGQVQRVALARALYRALATDCSIILLDEPTSAIDAKRAKLVVSSLSQLAAEGFAVIAISHQSFLIEASDKVIEVTR
ncbi:MAG: ATP-binding cassette domain-containing protein [Rhodoluna sp.]|nr:ATP-binding cassette domain-containing protein [Rhodoluna sp.]MBP6186155.1 ATP-binding cassette domain-containing protein [Rhodoluna sp.]